MPQPPHGDGAIPPPLVLLKSHLPSEAFGKPLLPMGTYPTLIALSTGAMHQENTAMTTLPRSKKKYIHLSFPTRGKPSEVKGNVIFLTASSKMA